MAALVHQHTLPILNQRVLVKLSVCVKNYSSIIGGSRRGNILFGVNSSELGCLNPYIDCSANVGGRWSNLKLIASAVYHKIVRGNIPERKLGNLNFKNNRLLLALWNIHAGKRFKLLYRQRLCHTRRCNINLHNLVGGDISDVFNLAGKDNSFVGHICPLVGFHRAISECGVA